eukprot:TRINITY_DN25_c0_g1_i6.p1 TRINITY_DN25_c0_g1~~TRINITY_DN25_c0_g1_i6.p1  ORF type:complete len:684 (+),score=197.78 TRINITY_DN25_c0_g1_i6:84-2135(+)
MAEPQQPAQPPPQPQQSLWAQPENYDPLGDQEFDVVVAGTGFIESVLAGALSRSGLKVLHLDWNDYYGADSASLTLPQFLRWLAAAGAETVMHAPEGWVQSQRGPQWNVDLSPRGCLSGGEFVEGLIDSQVGRYLEFKNVDRCLVLHGGQWVPLPGGRGAVFRSRHLQMMEKRRLMQLMQIVQHGVEQDKEREGGEGAACHAAEGGVPEEWRRRPFPDFLSQHLKMSDRLRGLVLHALCGLPAPPGGQGEGAAPACTADAGIARLRRVAAGIGLYGPQPYIYPSYGNAELPQALCRVCAVYRGIYVLRRGLSSVVLGPTGGVTGVTCTAGHRFNCRHVVLPHRRGTAELFPAAARDPEGPGAGGGEVRAVVFADRPLFGAAGAGGAGGAEGSGEAEEERAGSEHVEGDPPLCLATIPPGSVADALPPRTVLVWQLAQGTHASPQAAPTLHFTMACPTADEQPAAAAALRAVVGSFVDLDTAPPQGPEGGTAEAQSAEPAAAGAGMPRAHFAAFYALPSAVDAVGPRGALRADSEGTPAASPGEGVVLCPGPSGEPDVDCAWASARRLFAIVMAREKAARAAGARGAADPPPGEPTDVPFDPDSFLGRLPDPEASLPPVATDTESRLLGVAEIHPVSAQPAADEEPAAGEPGSCADAAAEGPPAEESAARGEPPAAHADPAGPL